MPPGGAPAAPAMSMAPGGGIEARPAVVVASIPPPPEVSTDPARVAERQGLASQMGAASSPDSALAAATASPTVEPQTSQSQTGGVETQQTSGQRAFDEIKNLDITIGPNTTVDELMAKLSAEERGEYRWQNDDETKAYVQGALDLVKQEAVETGQVVASQPVPENAAATATPDAAAVNPQTTEQATPNQPSEATIQQALTAMGKDDTPANREAAKQLIAAKEQQEKTKAEAAAQRVVDVVAGEDKKEVVLSPDDRAIAETFTDMIVKEPENFKKFFEAMTKDDPDGAKALAEILAMYKQIISKEDKARYNKIYMALGLVGFLAWLAFGVATNDGQH